MILWGILYLVVGVLIPVFCILPTYLELTTINEKELAFFDYLLCVDEYLDVNIPPTIPTARTYTAT